MLFFDEWLIRYLWRRCSLRRNAYSERKIDASTPVPENAWSGFNDDDDSSYSYHLARDLEPILSQTESILVTKNDEFACSSCLIIPSKASIGYTFLRGCNGKMMTPCSYHLKIPSVPIIPPSRTYSDAFTSPWISSRKTLKIVETSWLEFVFFTDLANSGAFMVVPPPFTVQCLAAPPNSLC